MVEVSMALRALADRVDGSTASDNALDVLVEVAMFDPDEDFTSIRANAAGTKVIYSMRPDGRDLTSWAFDWTAEKERAGTSARLRARADLLDSPIEKGDEA